MSMRLVFCGTPEFALPSLRRLLAEPSFQVEAVVTQPDRPRGRGRHVSASPVKQFALDEKLYVYQPEKIRDESAFNFFKRLNPDAVVIIAYGQKIPQALLDVPRLGWINLHGSLLPKYRGAAPINWAIVNGESKTGITTMQVDAGMDTGPILLQKEMEIGADETAPELSRRMSVEGSDLVVDSLLQLDRGEIVARPQDKSQATSAPLLKKQHGLLDWSLTAQQVYNRIRGFDPWPGAYTFFRGQHCRIWGRSNQISASENLPAGTKSSGALFCMRTHDEMDVLVSCSESTWLRLEAVQLEGKKRVSAQEFVNGARLSKTERFQSTQLQT
ncbi:MAG TPA: methionyl-tRNA formyltransferase [Candidatus Limnocylindrales bacterium]|nr:methionyl-tRNA formyltransferase [Candidatus Limnocylindrales bacterium]